MTYDWIESYCLSKTGAIKEFKEEWGVFRYMVAQKMFVMDGNDNRGKHILTLKVNPVWGQSLRDTYKDISPGYYMNKVHWNSVDLAGDVPEDILKAMIDESYDLIFSSLTKKMQKEVLENKS